MHSTKELILANLKRSGGSTVESLATQLGLARMTVRQHLMVLERDALVVSREERLPKGRPHLLFSLSERGEELFPKRYERLADLALQEVAFLDSGELSGLSPEDKKRLLLRKMAERVFREHEVRVRGKSLPERVAVVTDILREEGGFAEWTERGRQFEIADHNCVYRRVADTHGEVCEWHLSLLARLLGNDVRCTQFMRQGGAEACRFVIEEESESPA